MDEINYYFWTKEGEGWLVKRYYWDWYVGFIEADSTAINREGQWTMN